MISYVLKNCYRKRRRRYIIKCLLNTRDHFPRIQKVYSPHFIFYTPRDIICPQLYSINGYIWILNLVGTICNAQNQLAYSLLSNYVCDDRLPIVTHLIFVQNRLIPHTSNDSQSDWIIIWNLPNICHLIIPGNPLVINHSAAYWSCNILRERVLGLGHG